MEQTQQTWERYLHAYTSESDWPDHLLIAKFAYNTAIHTSTGLPLFHVSHTYYPQIRFEPLPSVIEASEWALCWKDHLSQAQEKLQVVQERMIGSMK